MNLGPYPLLTECIIVSTKTKGGDIILAKNRDRMYSPTFKIVHTVQNGIEIAYWYDEDTGWAEGMNENGIGVVNTALMVGFDEKEKKIVKKTGQKSTDGRRIVAALKKPDMDSVLVSVTKYTGGVKGHTFVVDAKANKAYKIESSSQHKPSVKPLSLDNVTVRTNHGLVYPSAGYTSGSNYKSSKFRKIQAEKAVKNKGSAKEILAAMREKNYGYNSNLNMNRDGGKTDMVTSTQIAMNLSTLEVFVYTFKKLAKFTGVERDLPDGHKPKIKITVIKDE